MECVGVVYQRKERIKIIGFDGKDYLVQDEATGIQYMIDAHYFRRHYTSIDNRLPVHTELWEKLDSQARTLYQMKQLNKKLMEELKGERKKVDNLRKQSKGKQHLRKGQKRGRHGRNG